MTPDPMSHKILVWFFIMLLKGVINVTKSSIYILVEIWNSDAEYIPLKVNYVVVKVYNIFWDLNYQLKMMVKALRYAIYCNISWWLKHLNMLYTSASST